jgi:hypothetical protein
VIDRYALAFVAVLIGLVAADYFLNDSRALMFLLLKFVDLIEYVSFWR